MEHYFTIPSIKKEKDLEKTIPNKMGLSANTAVLALSQLVFTRNGYP